jgi:hypothetical protein
MERFAMIRRNIVLKGNGLKLQRIIAANLKCILD